MMVQARNVCLAAALAVIAGGAVSFAGWAFDIPRLTDWAGSGITIKTNPSLLAMAAGLALAAYACTPRLRAVTAALGAAVAAVAFATLMQHVTGLDFGIDNLVYTEAPGSPATVSPNRMGMPASTCFTLLGVSLCLRAARLRRHRFPIGSAVGVFALGMLSLTGYWYRAEAIYTVPKYTAIAPQTAAILVVLSLGIITAFPDSRPTRTIFADDSAGVLARRLLPFLFGVPLVLGWLRLEGERLGWYDTPFGTALRTWAEVAILGALAWWAIEAIRRREQARSAAEAALREADRRKDAFLATLSHELRNPLAPIRNSASILMVKGPLPAPLQWATEVIERQVRHMTRLLDDLLDVSRITRDRLELRRARLDVSDAVRSALETSRPLIDAARHELQVELCAEPLLVDGDADRLAQVFSNLLNNAAKYTPAGGHVRIAMRREGERAVVEVRDDGIGIGLSLARGVVELHGGRIDAESAGTGAGSTFTVRLPCATHTGAS